MRLGALEAGGTKMVCAIGDENGNVFERESFPTRMPEETMPPIIAYFKEKGIEALGVSSFGPLNLDENDPHYGDITTTPKPGWANYPLRRVLMEELNVPVGIDTDVNGAAMAEALIGAGKGLDSLVYYTIGTGIGGGAMVSGKRLHGLVHPEMGHMLLRPHKDDPTPHGFCPYHDGCLEGMANGPAIEKRWGVSAKELAPDHPAWDLEAEYLAQMCVNTIVVLSPKMIVLGGGVMHQMHLFPKIRKRTQELLNGYVAHDAIRENIDNYIVPPALGDNAGAAGSLLLAVEALKN
ncbi:MAG: ROK family protein [Clostridia bacterium]|nr:ROK family protein [Clostridia bacterium]